jgi:rhomboid protease GluP
MIDGRTSVGASGAVFGAAGGLIAFFARHHSVFRVRDARVATVLVVWAIYQFGLGLLNPFIDNWAHLGGLVGGLLVGLLMDRRLQGGRGGDLTRPVQAVALLLACLVLIAIAIHLIPRLLK